MSIKAIITKASECTLEEKEVIAYSKSNRISLDDFAHEFSIDIAKNYRNGVYDYSFCDGAMNWLYGFMTNPEYLKSNNNSISELPLDIYLAFDAGEYHHGGDDESIDPVKKYTDPAIDKVLSAIST